MDFSQIIEFEVAQISAMDILTFLLALISLCLAVRRYRISFDNNIINYVNSINSRL
jgi:hypothetical protein